jgi:hypothetical protein
LAWTCGNAGWFRRIVVKDKAKRVTITVTIPTLTGLRESSSIHDAPEFVLAFDPRMAVPWNPEAVDTLRARYAAALVNLYDHRAIAAGRQPRPGNHPRQVFDFQDGLRLIISRDRQADQRTGIFVSGSIVPGTPLEEWLRAQEPKAAIGLRHLVCERWQCLAGSDRVPEFVGWSARKGVPHFVMWDTH